MNIKVKDRLTKQKMLVFFDEEQTLVSTFIDKIYTAIVSHTLQILLQKFS